MHYYPFGMLMPGRIYSSDTYRYGFNGKESDGEINGTTNSFDAGARIYDSRIAKWLSVDPLNKDYPDVSPFAFVSNSPIKNVEIDGNYWIESTLCYIGTCPLGKQGHEGFHKISSAQIKVTKISDLKALNIAGCVPFLPEISWSATFTKAILAGKDNSVSFGFSDWLGIGLGVIGMKVGSSLEQLGKVDAAVALELMISTASFSADQYTEFKKTDYYQLLLDAKAVQILQTEGIGEVDENGTFTFNKKWLDEEHKKSADDVKNDPNAKNVKFGETLYLYKPQEMVKKKIEKIMNNARIQAANELDSAFEDANKKKQQNKQDEQE